MSNPPSAPRLLVIGTETREQRQERRASSGASSAESFASTLAQIVPGARIDTASCVDDDAFAPDPADFDAVFFAGSTISLHEESDAGRRACRAMERVLRAGTPAFGSCAGLHIAVVATGGSVRPSGSRLEAGFGRRIVATEAGRTHPLMKGRKDAFDALTMHSDEVENLPDGATILAVNDGGRVQAVEIRSGPGIVWAVQYHPEISLAEVAASLRREAEMLTEKGYASDRRDIEEHAAHIEDLAREPSRRDLRWRLGVCDDVTDPTRSRLDITNFLDHFRIGARAEA